MSDEVTREAEVAPKSVPSVAPAMGRRTFLKAAAAGAAAFGMPFLQGRAFGSTPTPSPGDRPNILVLIVDQMREPRWFPQGRSLDTLLPAYASLRKGAVNFTNAYSAATLCSPARAGLLTGLYTHQNGLLRCVDGPEPSLDPAFGTWGNALRNSGYKTNWYGKWHLSYGDSLDDYGFDGGTFPSPNGGPQEGTNVDSHIVDQFLGWFDQNANGGPWATTVSLVNPHDIVYYYKYTEDYFRQNPPPSAIRALPGNFETAQQLQSKPRLQQAHQFASDRKYGVLPFEGDGWEQEWLTYLNAYAAFQQLADRQLGRVLAALDARPDVRDNTVIVFLSDHGEYGGSHGLRGKGGSAYDEIMHVPLLVKDPRRRLTAREHVDRNQFVSLVDLYGLFLTIGTGNNDWRGQPQYAHLRGRLDVEALLRNPQGAGREYVLHTYDEGGAKTLPGSDDPIPGHVIGLHAQNAKLVTYNKWDPGTIDIDQDVQETEVYDYYTDRGRLELDDVTRTSPQLFSALHNRLLNDVLPNELRQPLPAALEDTRQNALQNYYDFLKAAKKSKKAEGAAAPAGPILDEGD